MDCNNEIMPDFLFDKFLDIYTNLKKTGIPTETGNVEHLYICARSERDLTHTLHLSGIFYPSFMIIDRKKNDIINTIEEARSRLELLSRRNDFEIQINHGSWKEIRDCEAQERLNDKQGCILRVSKEKLELLEYI